MTVDELTVHARTLEEVAKSSMTESQKQILQREGLPKIVLCNKLKVTGGKCWSRKKLIKINPHATEDHQREILAHELAHYFAYWLSGYRGHHGFPFRVWCYAMKIPADRCHDYPELMALARGETYICEGCRKQFKSQSNIEGRIHRRPCLGKVVLLANLINRDAEERAAAHGASKNV